jgi:hypothetical protein
MLNTKINTPDLILTDASGNITTKWSDTIVDDDNHKQFIHEVIHEDKKIYIPTGTPPSIPSVPPPSVQSPIRSSVRTPVQSPVNSSVQFTKNDFKVGDKLHVNRPMPNRDPSKNKKFYPGTALNEVTVTEVNSDSIKIEYSYNNRVSWSGKIYYYNMFKNNLSAYQKYSNENPDNQYIINIITNKIGGDPYYLKYLKYKTKYLELKNEL